MAFPVLAAVGAAGSFVAGLFAEMIGAANQAGEVEKAKRLLQQAIDEYGPEIIPEIEKAQAERVNSEFKDLRASPDTVNRQKALLDRLAMISEGGITPEDEAQQRAAMEAAGGVAARGAAQAEQLAARRGLLRSGLSQALGQDAAQAGAQQASDIAAQLAGQRQTRAMQALQSLGGFAGQMRGQEWEEASGRARALDDINRFNSEMAFRAQAERNRNALEKFRAEMALRDAKNQQRANLAQLHVQSGANQRETARNIGAGVSKGFQTVGSLGGKP